AMEWRRKSAAREHPVDFVLGDARIAQCVPSRVGSEQERTSARNAAHPGNSRADDGGFRSKATVDGHAVEVSGESVGCHRDAGFRPRKRSGLSARGMLVSDGLSAGTFTFSMTSRSPLARFITITQISGPPAFET